MGIPIDDSFPPTDDEPVDPEPAPPSLTRDSEAPVADVIEQTREVLPGWRVSRVSDDPEVPENDAIDQALEVPAGDILDD
jgi:hypothetical protein